jgi:hypothetical protein
MPQEIEVVQEAAAAPTSWAGLPSCVLHHGQTWLFMALRFMRTPSTFLHRVTFLDYCLVSQNFAPFFILFWREKAEARHM